MGGQEFVQPVPRVGGEERTGRPTSMLYERRYRRRRIFQLSAPGIPAREWVERRRFRGELLWLLAWLTLATAAVGAVYFGQAGLMCVATNAMPLGT